MGLRRGFKTEAAGLAKEIRAELGLGPFDRLDPHELARHLEIPVLALSELEESVPDAVRYFLSTEPEAFSAVTVFRGHHRAVVHNDAHAGPRQNNSLTHELAHGLLHHEPTPALDEIGCRNLNSTNEDEADWLAGVLLVTEEMALAVARGQFTPRDAERQLGVSPPMLTWRLNKTGAHKRVARARAARQRAKHPTSGLSPTPGPAYTHPKPSKTHT